MLGLKKAGRRLVVVPPHQAYGSTGVPGRVPAHSTLVFETELRRVTPSFSCAGPLHLVLLMAPEYSWWDLVTLATSPS